MSQLFSFSYPISRPYPFGWFKWAVLVGGICVTVLFSILNFAANGYVLKVQYTTDLNATITKKPWAQKIALPADDKMAPSCQSQNLQVNTQYYTDKLSLIYNLESIWRNDSNGKVVTLPALQYANNPLKNCTITLIELDMSSFDDRTAAQFGWTAWGADAFGMVTCSVDNDNGPTWVNLTVHYEYVTPTIETGAAFQFVQPPNETTQASFWWGESLLSWYWMNLVHAMDNQSMYAYEDRSRSILKGSIGLRPSLHVTDITNLDFFPAPQYHFVTEDMGKNQEIIGFPGCCINQAGNPPSIGGLHDNGTQPDVWIEADSFAKVFYSVVLADLGQNSSLNLLANPSTLAAFTKNITSMKMVETGTNMKTVETGTLRAGPAREPFDENSHETLMISPSVFYTQYLCQIPTRKSAGSLIIAILVADLVFLNAAWMLLNWFAVTRVQRSVPTANYCAGCATSTELVNLVEPSADSSATSRYEPIRGEQPS